MTDAETPLILNTDGPHSGEYSRKVADHAAEAIQVLCHATLGNSGGLDYPTDADAVIRSLAILASKVPQLLEQIYLWLALQEATGRLSVWSDTYQDSPYAALEATKSWLAEAKAAAGALHEALQVSARITALMGVPYDLANDPDA